ncbi:hypothetical protein EV356DRAFT_363664 [Viridothelium virens]|uniref:BTB domain-containing protein n=1 Tax=Viridothelium virens TaxID=1048519 RepID=A0A6A6HIG8_VIRVR|nr:hypothetical protein EV356DRAFT_363664 [Viridothelium virens]
MSAANLGGDGGDGFPEFNDGNVIIIIAAGYQFKLHLDHLKRSAERFRKLFAEGAASANQSEAVYGKLSRITAVDEAPAAPPPRKKAKKADATHYLVLQGVDERDLDTNCGVLVPTNKDAIIQNPMIAGNLNAKIEQRYIRLWRNVLGALYHADMTLDQTDLATLIKDSVGMVSIARYLGCLPVVSYRIEHALISQGDTLWKSILNNPVAWMDLAWRVGARDIFKECLIHLAGIFHRLTADEKRSIPYEVFSKVEEKAQLLERYKASVDFRLASWISPDLKPGPIPPGGKVGQDHGRTAYADQIYMWIAQHLFDHFLKFAFQNGDNRGAPDGGFHFYQTIYRGGDAYLKKSDQDRFHQGDCPMTPKAQRVLFNAIADLKIQAKEVVRPLFTNAAKIDREKEKLLHFTCVPVTDEELEWLHIMKGIKKGKSRGEGEGEEEESDESEHAVA